MKLHVDGEIYDWDNERFMASEAVAVQKYTGFNVSEFNAGLRNQDATAQIAMVWLARRRAGETDLAFADVDFDLITLRLEPNSEDEVVVEDVEGPTSSGEAGEAD